MVFKAAEKMEARKGTASTRTPSSNTQDSSQAILTWVGVPSGFSDLSGNTQKKEQASCLNMEGTCSNCHWNWGILAKPLGFKEP